MADEKTIADGALAAVREDEQGGIQGTPLTLDMSIFSDEFNARELAQPNCKNCGGQGYVGSGPMAPLCPCTQLSQYRRAAEARIRRLFGKGEQRWTFAAFDTGGIDQNEDALLVAKNFVRKWQQAADEGWILGFAGMPGTGKTHLVTAMSMALIKRHLIKPMILSVPKLLFLERQRFGAARGQAGKSLIELAMEADLTVLDELGGEQSKAADSPEQVTWVQEQLYLILDERIRRGLPTLYTTNLSRNALRQHFGEGTAGGRLWSRIERAEVMPALEMRPVGDDKRLRSSDARDALLGL